jgi:hypothetical protein
MEASVARICGEVVLKRTKENAFREISSADFAKKIDSNFAHLNIEILFQNERFLRTLVKLENVGNLDMERIYIPENYTIISQRKPPMIPFVYFLGIQMLFDHKDGALLKWVEEFEISDDNKSKEEGIVSRLEQNEILHFQKVQNYFDSGN